jgi:hypothetical protein
VDPGKKQEMLHNFHNVFRPAAMKQPGFIDVKMLKLRSALSGATPSGANYRFELIYASEEQRKVWVDTATHKRSCLLLRRHSRRKITPSFSMTRPDVNEDSSDENFIE